MSNEPKIQTHTYQDPFTNKKVTVVSHKGREITNQEDVILNSQEDFSTLLEEVKQYNNDPTNIEEHRSKRIII